MRIAVTYENGAVFQHFGRSPAFKIYNVEGGKILSSAVLPTNGQGHSALADFLAAQKVDVVICGGIGSCALDAFGPLGIQYCAGASGPADLAVLDYLAGRLTHDPSACHVHGAGHVCGGHGIF